MIARLAGLLFSVLSAVNPLKMADGKPTVLVFVRTDCPISNRYAPLVEKLNSQYENRVRFWLVYPDKDESDGQIEEHQRQYRYHIQAVRDPKLALAKMSHVDVTPEAAVFSAQGELLYHGGIDNWYLDLGHARQVATTHELADAIEAAVKGERPRVSSARGVGCSISDLE